MPAVGRPWPSDGNDDEKHLMVIRWLGVMIRSVGCWRKWWWLWIQYQVQHCRLAQPGVPWCCPLYQDQNPKMTCSSRREGGRISISAFTILSGRIAWKLINLNTNYYNSERLGIYDSAIRVSYWAAMIDGDFCYTITESRWNKWKANNNAGKVLLPKLKNIPFHSFSASFVCCCLLLHISAITMHKQSKNHGIGHLFEGNPTSI